MSETMTDKEYIELAKKYLAEASIPHGKFWQIINKSGRVTVWFWRARKDIITNPSCTMNKDGLHPISYA